MTIAAKTEQKGKSPYARHRKVPTLYSLEHQNWKEAFKKGRESEAKHWAHEHSKRFAPTPSTQYDPSLMGPLHTEPRRGRHIQ